MLLEVGVEVEEAEGGAEKGDPGLNAGGITVVVGGGVEVEGHPLGEALEEGRDEDGGIEPEAEPVSGLGMPVPYPADEAAGLVGRGEACLELVAAAAGDEDHRVELRPAAWGLE